MLISSDIVVMEFCSAVVIVPLILLKLASAPEMSFMVVFLVTFKLPFISTVVDPCGVNVILALFAVVEISNVFAEVIFTPPVVAVKAIAPSSVPFVLVNTIFSLPTVVSSSVKTIDKSLLAFLIV